MNNPLNGNDHAKLLFFALLILPTNLVFVGIIPSIFIIFGLFMMNRCSDFSHIQAAERNVKVFAGIVSAVLLLIAAYNYNQTYVRDESIAVPFVLGIISLLYIPITHYLFYVPLKEHEDWVVVNGIFSNKPKNQGERQKATHPEIIKGEKFKQYSVADELLKWSQLKESGHIGEKEFAEIKAKLLNGR